MDSAQMASVELSKIGALLDQILQQLRSGTSFARDEKDIRSRFWAIYKAEADEFDADFLGKCNQDLDIVLIFAGLFSAVSTTFIVGMQQDLSPDPNDTTHALLMTIAHSLNGTLFLMEDHELSPWNGPSSQVIWTQSILYASLVFSLLAAFGAVLCKQGLSRYARVGAGIRGTLEERCRARQRRLHGLQRWHFDAIVDALPLFLQLSLLLFGVGIAAFLWGRQNAIAAVVVAGTALGGLFYIFIVISSVVSSDSPFHTPLGRMMHASVGYYQHSNAPKAHKPMVPPAEEIVKQSLVESRSTTQSHDRPLSSPRHTFRRLMDTFNRSPVELSRNNPWYAQNTPHSSLSLDLSISVGIDTDALGVAWLVETSTDPIILSAAAEMTLEVEWPLKVPILGCLVQLSVAFAGCFRKTHHDVYELIPTGSERAIVLGKAFIHLYLERRNLSESEVRRGHEPGPSFHSQDIHIRKPDALHALASRHLNFDWIRRVRIDQGTHYSTQLTFITGMLLDLFNLHAVRPDGSWIPGFGSIPDSVVPWIMHSLLHCLWGDKASDATRNAILRAITRSLTSQPLPSPMLQADCVLGAGLMMGLQADGLHLIKLNKSPALPEIIRCTMCQLMESLSDRLDWDDRSAWALQIFEPLCSYIKADGHSAYIADELRFPMWCLHLGRRVATRPPRLSLTTLHRRTRKIVQSNPQAYFRSLSRQALRMAVCVAGPPFVPSHRQKWYIQFNSLYGVRLAAKDVEWLLPFATSLRDESLSVESDNRQIYHLSMADCLLVLSLVPMGIDMSLQLQILDFAVWALHEDHPSELRDASIKLVQSRCASFLDAKVNPIAAFLLHTDFSAKLHSVISSAEPLQEGDKSEEHFERDCFYLDIIYALLQAPEWDRRLVDDGHVDRCMDMVLRHFEHFEDCVSLVDVQPRQEYTLDHVWARLAWIMLRSGWIPENTRLKLEVFAQAWQYYTFLDTVESHHQTLFVPLIAGYTEDHILHDPGRQVDIQLTRRLVNIYEWMQYCQAQTSTELQGRLRGAVTTEQLRLQLQQRLAHVESIMEALGVEKPTSSTASVDEVPFPVIENSCNLGY